MPPRQGPRDRAPTAPRDVIETLANHEVDYMVIGGLAVIAHGSQRVTRDFDLLLNPATDNCRRMIAALVEIEAKEYLPASKRWVPVSPDADPVWLLRQPRFFDTTAGGVDVCNGIEGVPAWNEVNERATEIEVFGQPLKLLGKDDLIRSKLAAGREQDLQDVAELAAE